MRDIKFRAWDSRTSEMLTSESDDGCCISIDSTGRPHVEYEYEPIDEPDLLEQGIWRYHLDYTTVMQYTGWKDADEQEIFEGDIVLTHDCGDVFDDWIVVFNDVSFELQSPQNKTYIESMTVYSPSDFQVVGNIYETPWLLEGEE